MSNYVSAYTGPQIDLSVAARPDGVIVGDGTDQTAAVAALFAASGLYRVKGTVKCGAVSISGKNLTIQFDEGASIQGISGTNKIWSFTNCNMRFRNLNIDGNGLAQTGVFMSGGTLEFDTATFVNMGVPGTLATDWITGFWLSAVTSIRGRLLKCSGFNSTGNGTFADNIGAVRGMLLVSCGAYAIGTVDYDASNTDGEEIDCFHVNTGNTGGTIGNLIVRYNGNTRRCGKYQSGNNFILNADVRKSSDFAAVSGSTDAGLKNYNCIAWEGNTAGSLDVLSGYVDASAFEKAIGNNTSGSTAPVRVHAGVTLVGGTKNVIRNDPQTGSPQNLETYGFFTGTGEDGSGVSGAKIVNFMVGAYIRCKNGYSRHVTYDDPVNRMMDFGTGTQIAAPAADGNTIITRTSGYCNGSSILPVANVLSASLTNNRLVEEGNTLHSAVFINVNNASATFSAHGNRTPSGTSELTVTAGTLTGGINLAQEARGNLPVANLNGGTSADAHHDWAGDGTWRQRLLTVPYSIVNNGSSAWTSMPLAETMLFGASSRNVSKIDLTGYTQVRLVVRVATVGAAASKLIAKYAATDGSFTVSNYSDIGTSEVSVAINTATYTPSAWTDLASGAKADVFVAVTGSGGDGSTSPAFGNIYLQFR